MQEPYNFVLANCNNKYTDKSSQMKTTNNTVLITGGSMGIGFEIAQQLSEKGNHVIITGRDKNRLEAAAAKLNNVTAIAYDVTDAAQTTQLATRLADEFPQLNILINNAGYASSYETSVADATGVAEKAALEMNTNYLSLVRLTEQLLPQLRKQEAAAVVNVTSIVAIAPGMRTPTYSASKAAVHAYTRLLRLSLKDSTVKVFELMPPLVATEFSKEIGGLENGIPAAQVAGDLVNALENNKWEIHVGATAQIFALDRQSPEQALHALNGVA